MTIPSEATVPVPHAYLRTLRDIDCGHITLYVTVCRYDVTTGARLPQPVIDVAPDRQPAGGLSGVWWEPMVQRGHLELVDLPISGCLYRVTDAGRALLAAHGMREQR